MLIVTLWAVVVNEINFVNGGEWLLAVINGVVFALAVWMVIEGIVSLRRWSRTPSEEPAVTTGS